ncbi:MAG: type VI secretion system baseplate subunit TssK [Planctomycetota bacterium]
MNYLPVSWHEGMFLRPHHFQASDRHGFEFAQTSEKWDHPCNYGIRTLELSDGAIAHFQFQVNVCHARMRDGSLVELNPGQEPDIVDLQAALTQAAEVTAYLAIPKLKIGSQNLAEKGAAGKSRYVQDNLQVQDENQGGGDQELQFRRLNVRILLSTEDSGGYDLLPLCRILRSGGEAAVPCIDPTYFPPMLAIDAWPPLGRDIFREIYYLLGNKISSLSEQLSSREVNISGLDPGDLERMLWLSELNQAYCTLRVLAFAPGVHPLHAYTELCRIVGQLCFFGSLRRPPEIPVYDHDDLATIFRYIRDEIHLLLKLIPTGGYVRRDFVGEGLGMKVSLESEWLGNEWRWFVGVLRQNLDERECVALLEQRGLNWKLGSASQVDELFRLGIEGLRLEKLAQAPQALPPRRDWLYFEVSRDNAAWKDVVRTQTLAMRLKESMIANRKELQGGTKIVVSLPNKQVVLQFALFAVPNPQGRS